MSDITEMQIMPQGAPPSAAKPAMGAATSRVDGRLKVTGAARYGSDFYGGANPAHAYLATSSIARGRITRLDEAEARKVPGVLDILTYRNVGDRIKPGKIFSAKGYMGTSIAPLASDRVQHDGQIVAMVVAETFEAAREAAYRLRHRVCRRSTVRDLRQPRPREHLRRSRFSRGRAGWLRGETQGRRRRRCVRHGAGDDRPALRDADPAP